MENSDTKVYLNEASEGYEFDLVIGTNLTGRLLDLPDDTYLRTGELVNAV